MAIRNLITRPCPGYKTCRIEVGVYHGGEPQEELDVVAKFRALGSAVLFAQQVARGQHLVSRNRHSGGIGKSPLAKPSRGGQYESSNAQKKSGSLGPGDRGERQRLAGDEYGNGQDVAGNTGRDTRRSRGGAGGGSPAQGIPPKKIRGAMKDHLHYILDGHRVVPAPDALAWGRWFAEHWDERVVAKTKLDNLRASVPFRGGTGFLPPTAAPVVMLDV
jgi:hypothetical protein